MAFLWNARACAERIEYFDIVVTVGIYVQLGRCQEAMGIWDVHVRWCPGHIGIMGNEVADRLADLEAHVPHDPSLLAAEPAVTGLRTDARALMRGAQQTWWAKRRPKLSTWYSGEELPYKTTSQAELTLSRHVLAKFLAMRMMQDDFAWYH